MWYTIADTCDIVETDIAVREDDVDLPTCQLGHSSMIVGSSNTLQPYHSRPTDCVLRTRDAGAYLMVFR